MVKEITAITIGCSTYHLQSKKKQRLLVKKKQLSILLMRIKNITKKTNDLKFTVFGYGI